VYGVGSVERAHEEHYCGHAETAEDCVEAPTPAVRKDAGRDGDCEDHEGGDAGGEKFGLVGCEAGLLEEDGRVLNHIMSIDTCKRKYWRY
jgi:hypothetical protein